jgi:hypothetical protein
MLIAPGLRVRILLAQVLEHFGLEGLAVGRLVSEPEVIVHAYAWRVIAKGIGEDRGMRDPLRYRQGLFACVNEPGRHTRNQ